MMSAKKQWGFAGGINRKSVLLRAGVKDKLG